MAALVIRCYSVIRLREATLMCTVLSVYNTLVTHEKKNGHQKYVHKNTKTRNATRNHGIGFVTTLSAAYYSSSGRSVLASSRGCQQLLELSGLKPMWLPAIVPDLVLPKIPYKRQVGITDVSYKQQRKYRCKVKHMWSRPLQYCQRLSRSWS